jgi:hypothetical protein
MAGRVQISALGETLNINPSFSFFTRKYSKHTNYATEMYKISFPEKVYTGDTLDVPIHQNCGDILQEVTLSFSVNPDDLPSIISGESASLSPVDIFGISVIDYVELYVGDQLIDKITGDDIFIHRDLNIPESYRTSLDTLHGNPFYGSADREFLQEFYDGQYNTQGIEQFTTDEYRVQIPFYFNRHPEYGFPLCSVYKQELSLKIKLRPAVDVVFASQERFEDVTLWDPEANNRISGKLELKNFKVNLDVVHLDVAERHMLKNKPIEVLFEQHQRNEFQIDPQSKTGTFKLDFINCVKELIFIAKKTGHWTQEQIAIMDSIYELDNLTDAQISTLTLLKQVPLWGDLAKVALSTLVGEDDAAVRNSTIDVLLGTVRWGGTLSPLLEALRNPLIDSVTEAGYITNLNQYIEGIPSLVYATIKTITTSLASLETETDGPTREATVDSLLAIDYVWDEEHIGYLNDLRDPSILGQVGSRLVLKLRNLSSKFSYYLNGLDTLPPGREQQLTLISGIVQSMDDTRYQSDILRLGIRFVVNDIPGKTKYLRDTIINGLLRIGGQFWAVPTGVGTQTFGDVLETLRNEDINITVQATNIATLNTFIDGTYNNPSTTVAVKILIKGITHELGQFPGETATQRTARVTALRDIPVWGDTIIQLVNSLSLLVPGAPGRDDVINTLLGYLQMLGDGIPTIQFNLNLLKDGINGLLDSLPGTALERDPIIMGIIGLHTWTDGQLDLLNALRIPGILDSTYITLLKNSTPLPDTMTGVTQSKQFEIIQGLLSQNIWGNNFDDLYDLRLIEPGAAGHTTAVDTIVTYLTTLSTTISGLTTDLGTLLQTSDLTTHNTIVNGLTEEEIVYHKYRAQWSKLIEAQYDNPPNGLYDSSVMDGIANDNTNGHVCVIGSYLSASDVPIGNGFNLPSAPTVRKRFIIKYDREGVIQWLKILENINSLNDIQIDSNGYIYICGYYDGTSVDFGNNFTLPNLSRVSGFIVQMDSDGDAQWADTVTATDYNNNPGSVQMNKIAIDNTNGYVYVSGQYRSNTIQLGNNFTLLLNYLKLGIFTVQYSTSGSVDGAFSMSMDSAVTYSFFTCNELLLDSENNLYWIGTYKLEGSDVNIGSSLLTQTSSLYNKLMVKFTNNNLTFDSKSSNNDMDLSRAIFDSDDFLYISGYYISSGQIDLGNGVILPSGTNVLYVIKYNEDFVAQQAFTLDPNQQNVKLQPFGIKIDSNEYIHLGVYKTVTNTLLVYKFNKTDLSLLNTRVIYDDNNSNTLNGNLIIDSNDSIYICAGISLIDNQEVDLGDDVNLDRTTTLVSITLGGQSFGFIIKYDALTPTNTSTLYKNAAWGGYNYMYLEGLKEPLTLSTIETEYISNLQTYTNVSFYSETTNGNLQFLLNQLKVRYPDPVFNKWIRAKKHVPLMYSKQKTTTLECDGMKILDETSGSNMFLSACLPNVYHKRSPIFRNINMYSFALYPNELRPSGHLNFSTIKDAYVKMDLEYDGAHGTFDFDDNYIELFGIPPIYFPKQVIIIAKSYNMMIIRDGVAKIRF